MELKPKCPEARSNALAPLPVVLKLQPASEFPAGLVETQITGPTPEFLIQQDGCEAQEFTFPFSSQGDSRAADVGTTL